MSLSAIKSQVKTTLDALVTDTVLAGAAVSDIKQDPLNANTPAYPYAYLMPPSIESEILDNRTIVRAYTFSIMVLWNAENIASATEVEEDIEAILSKFDNDPTLNGTATAGMLPLSSSPQPFQHNGKDLVMAIIELQAKTQVTLTFS